MFASLYFGSGWTEFCWAFSAAADVLLFLYQASLPGWTNNNDLPSQSSKLLAATAIGHIMRIITLLSLLTLSIFSKGQTNNPFLKLNYDKVVMYDFEGSKGYNLSIVDDKGQLATSIKKEIQLDKTTITKLNTKLGDKKSYGAQTAACFDPHLGFVYFLKDSIVGHITICLSCNRLVSSIDIPIQKQGKVGTGKDAYYIGDGMSESFRQFLKELLIKNSFSLSPKLPG